MRLAPVQVVTCLRIPLKRNCWRQSARFIIMVNISVPWSRAILVKSYVKNVKNESKSLEHENSLSKREIEILKLFADGHSNKEISEKLLISSRTVESHKKSHHAETRFKIACRNGEICHKEQDFGFIINKTRMFAVSGWEDWISFL